MGSPGIEACMLHLNESFALGEEGDAVGGAQAENSSAEETGDEAVQSQATNETAGEENSVEETVDEVDESPATNETSESLRSNCYTKLYLAFSRARVLCSSSVAVNILCLLCSGSVPWPSETALG